MTTEATALLASLKKKGSPVGMAASMRAIL